MGSEMCIRDSYERRGVKAFVALGYALRGGVGDVDARYEIWEKGNTRTMIPNAPTTAPAAHAHRGMEESLSNADHADSGIASAESIAFQLAGGSGCMTRVTREVLNYSSGETPVFTHHVLLREYQQQLSLYYTRPLQSSAICRARH